MPVPYIIYADFEALNIPVKDVAEVLCNKSLVAKQVPCSYCYVVVRCDGEVKDPILYREENAAKKFLNSL